MNKSLIAAAWAAAAACAPAVSAQALSADAFARAPAVASVNMSNEGDMLVGVIADPRDEDRRALATWDISNVDGTQPLAPAYITPSDKMTFYAAQALKAGKVIAIANQPWTGSLGGCGEGREIGATKTWVNKVMISDRTIKKLEDPFAAGREVGISDATRMCLEIGATPRIIDLPLDSENVIVARTDPTSLQARYSRVNLKTDKAEPLYRDTGELAIGLIDPRDGKVRSRQKVDPKGNLEYNAETYILNPDTNSFDLETPLTVDFKTRNTMAVAGYDEETGKYFVVTDKFSDKTAVYLYDARTDKFDAEPLFAHADFDAAGVVLGRHPEDFGKILGFSYLSAYGDIYWTDPGMKSIHDGLQAAFKGRNVQVVDWTADRNKVLFTVDDSDFPTGYYLLVNKTKLLQVGNQRPWIKPETLGKGSLVYYDARDGLKIPGLLTLPPGFKKGDPAPPAVVLPHGGPWARDYLGWDGSGWTQYLATRGYAVLQPQYRGSEGWGHKLWVAGDAEWGQKMQDDKDDGANWMVKEGYAAEGRIGIFGYSYGGFAAFAASVRPNGPFKCAIAGAGVSNLARIGQNWGENRQQRAYQGRTVTGMDPQKNTDKLSMPILIFHGDRDVRVPLFHANDFYNSVKSTGKAKLLVLKDMGHQSNLWTPDNTRKTLTAIGDFFEKDCKL